MCDIQLIPKVGEVERDPSHKRGDGFPSIRVPVTGLRRLRENQYIVDNDMVKTFSKDFVAFL